MLSCPAPFSAQALPLHSVVREGKAAEAGLHTHREGQLLYPSQGASLVETEGRVIRVSPDRAAWIPANVPHAVLMNRTYRYHSLYIDNNFYEGDQLAVILVRPLLRELIVDVCSWSDGQSEVEQWHRKAHVIVDELRRAPRLETGIQVPDDPRIGPICRELEGDPSNVLSLDEWASKVAASTKTIQRVFMARTGLSFQQWRNYVRMTRALELHGLGMRQLDIAMAVGYSTEGAYAQAFKKFYGYPPSRRPL